jgi:hypothetical protein
MQTWQTNIRDLRAQWEGLRERFADGMLNGPPGKIRELDELLAAAVVGGNNAFAARPLPTPTCAGPTMIAPPAPTALPAHTFSEPTMIAPTAAATTRPLRGLSAWAQNAAMPAPAIPAGTKRKSEVIDLTEEHPIETGDECGRFTKKRDYTLLR